MRKLFDPALHAENDLIVKNAVKDLLKDSRYRVEDGAKRGVDLHIFYRDNLVFYIECERKKVWKEKFAYDSVQFPHRKQKFAELDKPTLFVMFNEDLSNYLTVESKELLDSPLVMVRNKYIKYGEEFFQVPIAKVKFGDLITSIEEMEI